MNRAPLIHLVDDDEAFQTAVSRLLRAAGYEVRIYPSAWEFLLTPFDEAPGCVLLDLHLPGPSGLDLQDAIAMKPGQLPIIFVTGYGDIPTTVRAMKAGAVDFLTKPVSKETLLKAVENALAWDEEHRAARNLVQKFRDSFSRLTSREREVFERVVAGRMNKEIAAELGLAERTVKAHRAQLMEKMEVSTLADLVHVAEQLRSTPSWPGNHLPRA